MPPLPTITDVFRVTLNWNTAHGIAPRNVLHFFASGATASDIADGFDAHVQSDQFNHVQQDWAFTSIDVLKLDGSSATQTVGVDAVGSLVSGDWIVGTAAVLSLHTAQRGSRGRGRLFLGPLPESRLSNGLIVDPTAIVTAWGTFFSGMSGDGIVPGVASYVHADFHVLTSHRIDLVPGQVRRRNNQQR